MFAGLLAACSSCILLASCAGDADQRANAVHVHPTIVSLNPCTDAILAEVAAPEQLLALSHYSSNPASSSMDVAKARQFPSVSEAVEDVAALSPDVVVASVFIAPQTRQALERLGIRVVTMPMVSDIAGAKSQVRELAALAGNRREGEALVARIDDALHRTAPPAGTRPLSALVWEMGGIVAGDRTLIADMLKSTGFANAAAARGLSQADYLPLEQALADPPDVILTVGDMQSEGNRMLNHPALAALHGVRRARLNSALLWCGGPTIPFALDRLAQIRRAPVRQAPTRHKAKGS